MARFKFGSKSKRRSDADLANISVISQGDYHSNYALKTPLTNGAHSPVLPLLEPNTYDYTEPSYMGAKGRKSEEKRDSKGHRAVSSESDRYQQQQHSSLEPVGGKLKIHPSNGLTSIESPWTRHKLFNSPFPRYRHAASSIPSDKGEFFMMGGLKEGSVFGDTWKIVTHVNGSRLDFTAESIDIANSTNPPARVGHASVLCGNAFIVYGGDTVETDHNGFPDNNFYLFNMNNNKYTVPTHILNKPHGRYGHTLGVIALNNQLLRLYLFGGQLENDVFNDLYYFELNTFKSPKARWETIEPLNNFKPPPLTNHSMSVHKNRIYVFGGVYNNEKVLNDLWCFDAIINKWTQINTTGAVPLPVNEHSTCIVSDKLYVYGGNDFQGTIYDTFYVLDLNLLVWLKLTEAGQRNSPGARCGHLMTYLPQHRKLIIMGGDKNDFVDASLTNYETYEEYSGPESVGTMIYELDIQSLEPFLLDEPAKKAIIGGRKKRAKELEEQQTAAATATIKPQTFESAEPQLVEPASNADYPTLEPRKEAVTSKTAALVGVGALAGVGGAIAGSAVLNDRNGPSTDADLVSFDHSSVSETKDLDPFKYAESRADDRLPVPTLEDDVVKPPQNGHAYGNVSRSISPPAGVDDLQQSVEVKKLVGELTSELNNLKASTAEQMELAHSQIEQLIAENKALKEQNSHYKEFDVKQAKYEKDISDRDVIIGGLRSDLSGEGREYSMSELSKHRLGSLELNNKIVYLEKENSVLKQKLDDFEPFMNNQITELLNFQKLIKAQEDKIEVLQNQVKNQESLEKEIVDLKHQKETLEIEFNNFKAIHEDEEIVVSDVEDEDVNLGGDNRSIHSTVTKRSKRDISQHLESLVAAWNSKNAPVAAAGQAKSLDGGQDSDLVAKLQQQVDELLSVSKEQQTHSTTEIDTLRISLKEKMDNLQNFEKNYKDALLSVNNTSKALDKTQEELEKQRELSRKLQKENDNYKLAQSSNKRVSKMVSSDPSAQAGASISGAGGEVFDERDEDEDFKNAHFNMKIQDLQADVFILKQERDELKDTVTTMKKQLYIAQQKGQA